MKQYLFRVLRLLAGLFLCALGVVVTLKANIGYSPWSVFHTGLAKTLGISFGTALNITGIAVVILAAILGEKLGLGTLLDMVLVGVFADLILALNIIPTIHSLPLGIIVLIAGLFIISFATYFYIGSGFGAGPRDGLMVALTRKTKLPVGMCRGIIEFIALCTGWLMGGMAGIGTVISVFAISFCIQFTFKLFKFKPADIVHETLEKTFIILRRIRMMKKIGFIGVGIMGKSMVRNLMKAGFELHIFARSKGKVEDVISEGAIFHESIRDCVKDCDAVITIVGYPKDVEDVYFGENNILESAKPGAYLIDMTTSSPLLAEKISEAGGQKGYRVMDAPVTGGDVGAKDGTLSIFVGGAKEDYEACELLFKAMGTNINYQGKAGCGQHAKLANQTIIAGTLSGVCEALIYARAKGLNLQTVLDSVSTGSAGNKQLDMLGPRILAGDYAPGFFMKHFIKDMKLALEEADTSKLNLLVLKQVHAICEMLEAEGCGDLGTQALIKFYEE